jgi:hypothetical protein
MWRSSTESLYKNIYVATYSLEHPAIQSVLCCPYYYQLCYFNMEIIEEVYVDPEWFLEWLLSGTKCHNELHEIHLVVC